jgi:prepilin peptidase CpaA
MMLASAVLDLGWLTLPHAEYAVALLIGGAAVVEDLARRTISNLWPVAAFAGGIACQVAASGWGGLGTALLGTVVGFLVFLVFYLLGGMGGGDVKLMAGFGALLGTGRLLQAALFTALVGGLLAVVVLGVHTLRRKRREGKADNALFIPYAPAIATGVWLALVAARP